MATPSPAACSASERSRFSVGLTGGIGSGKSLVADQLASCGALIIDTDAIAHRLTTLGGAAMAPIRDAFGADFIDDRGNLDRARMRGLVFDSVDARQELEAILHPLIRAQAEQDAHSAPGDAPYLVFAVPLLVEAGNWSARVNRVLVVDCPVAEQVRRVVQTRGLAPALAKSIVAQQATRAQRLDAADDVIANAGPATLIASRAKRLHRHYCALAAAWASGGAARPL